MQLNIQSPYFLTNFSPSTLVFSVVSPIFLYIFLLFLHIYSTLTLILPLCCFFLIPKPFLSSQNNFGALWASHFGQEVVAWGSPLDLPLSKEINQELPVILQHRSMAKWSKKDPELRPILGTSSTGARRSVASMDPHPLPISRRNRFLLVVCILFTELCERLTFYGIVANLVLYCRDYLKLEAPLPSSISLAFQGIFLFSC